MSVSVDATEALDLDRLGPALASSLSDDRWLDVSAQLISGGKSNLTFEITSPAGVLILRRPPTGVLLPRAHDMGREVRIQRALAPTAVPVARIVLADEGELLGVSAYVMERVDGHIIRGEMPPGYASSPAERRALAYALVDTLADLHSVDQSAIGLGDFGRPTGFLERQIKRWSGQWEMSADRQVDEVDELGRRLQAALPPVSESTIVHGDFRLDNCVVDLAEPGKMAAVLDWELATLGDPLSDLGTLLCFWRKPGEPHPVLTPGVSHLPGFPSRDDLKMRYQERTGRDLSNIKYYEAFGQFKFAIIAQGIAARVAAGAMSGQEFGDLRAEVREAAEMGLRVLD